MKYYLNLPVFRLLQNKYKNLFSKLIVHINMSFHVLISHLLSNSFKQHLQIIYSKF